jgi:hypothetical protein
MTAGGFAATSTAVIDRRYKKPWSYGTVRNSAFGGHRPSLQEGLELTYS